MKSVDVYTVLSDGSIANSFYFTDGSVRHYPMRIRNWDEFFRMEILFDSYILKVRAPKFTTTMSTRVEEE